MEAEGEIWKVGLVSGRRLGGQLMAKILENVEEIVLAVKDQKKTVAFFEELFGLEFDRNWTVPVDSMKVECAMIGDTQFHIVASTSPDTLIDKFIQQRGEGIHHIAFRVRNLDVIISKLMDLGVKLVPEIPREGREGGRYIFIHPKYVNGLLIELIER